MTTLELQTTFLAALNAVSDTELTWDDISITATKPLGDIDTEATVTARESRPGHPTKFVGETTVRYNRIDISNRTLTIDARDLFLKYQSTVTTADVLNHLDINGGLPLPLEEFVDSSLTLPDNANATFVVETKPDSFYFTGRLTCELVFPVLPYVDYTIEVASTLKIADVIPTASRAKALIYVDGVLFTEPVIPAGQHRLKIYGIDNTTKHTAIPATILHKLVVYNTGDLSWEGSNRGVLPVTLRKVDNQALYSEQCSLRQLFAFNGGGLELPTILFEFLGNEVDTSALFKGSKLTGLPSTLFYGVQLTNLEEAFYGTTGYTTLPGGLLAGQSELTRVLQCFANSSVEIIPANLLQGCTKLTTIERMFYNASVKTIEGPIAPGTPVEIAERTFCACSKLTTIPDTIFDGMSELISLFYTFADCVIKEPIVVSGRMFRDTVKLSTVNAMFARTKGIKAVVTPWVGLPVTDITEAFSATTVETVTGPITDSPVLTNAGLLFSGCTSLTRTTGVLLDTDSVVRLYSVLAGTTALQSIESILNPTVTYSNLATVNEALGRSGLPVVPDYCLGRYQTRNNLNIESVFKYAKVKRIGKVIDLGDASVTILADSFIFGCDNLIELSEDVVRGPNATVHLFRSAGFMRDCRNIRITTQQVIAAFNVKNFKVFDKTIGPFLGCYWIDGKGTDICTRYGITASQAKLQNWFRLCFRLSDYHYRSFDSTTPNDQPNLSLVNSRGWETPIALKPATLPAPYDRGPFPWVPYFRTAEIRLTATEFDKLDTLEKQIRFLSSKLDYDLAGHTWYTAPFTNLQIGSLTTSGAVFSIEPIAEPVTELKSNYFILRRV